MGAVLYYADDHGGRYADPGPQLNAPPRTNWDFCLSERGQEFVEQTLELSRVTGKPIDFEWLLLPLSDLADMARACLVELTDWDASDFETISDCAHHRRHVPEAADSPAFCGGLLDLLSHCLFIRLEIETFLDHRNDPAGYEELIKPLLIELASQLRKLDEIAKERSGQEATICQLIPAAERSERMRAGAAKGGSKPKRRWWAEELAQWLTSKSPTSEADAWNKIPDSGSPATFDKGLLEVIVYRDGDKLVAVDEDSQKESTLTRSTFLKQYYSGK